MKTAPILTKKAPFLGAFFVKTLTNFFDGWRVTSFCLVLLVVVPLLIVLSFIIQPDQETWDHLVEHLLTELLVNTAWLLLGVAFGTLVLGVTLGWLTGMCEFPGRRFFSWALLLPMALPAYVLAFTSLGILDFAGPVQTLLRALPLQASPRPFDIRSTLGIIVVMTLALYPYVYLLSRSAFMTQGKTAMEAARILKCSTVSAFFRVALPMARPWIAGGLILVMMETLADFGAVSVFNYNTLTTAIYKSWFGLFSLPAAAQLSSILVFVILAIILAEHRLRSRMQYTDVGRSRGSTVQRIVLTAPWKWLAFTLALSIALVAFFIPCLQLVVWSWHILSDELGGRYIGYLGRTVFLALTAATVTCCGAIILAYTRRRHPDRLTFGMIRIATLGYALPGTVLAVGFVILMTSLDKIVIWGSRFLFGLTVTPFLQSTVLAMIFAYLVRFMAPGFTAVDSAMQRITRSIDDVSRLMGVRGGRLLTRVHIPILRNGLLTGFIFVFVDVMKEMPLTLMTRPFGWDTLAVKIYEFTSEGQWEMAALPSVILVLAGTLPVITLLMKSQDA